MIINCDYLVIMPYFYRTKPFINLLSDFGCRMQDQSPKLETVKIIYLTILK